VVVLDDTTPDRDTSKDARDRCGVIASAQIRPDESGLACRVDPTRAIDIRSDVRGNVATGDDIRRAGPIRVMHDGSEPQSARCLLHAPDTPSFGVFDDTERSSEFHVSVPPRQ
jgi:hypothetical protein